MAQLSEWVSASEAARLTGLTVRTIKRMVNEKKLKASRSPGGHMRVRRAQLDGLLRPETSVSNVASSSALAAKRESLEALTLELQAERVRRDLDKLRNEDAGAEQRRAEVQRAEMLANKKDFAEIRLQERREAEERKHAKLARQREDFRRWWMRWASSAFPGWLSADQVQSLTETLERSLAGCDPREPAENLSKVLQVTIARAIAPFRAEREALAKREKLIGDAVTWRLPFLGTLDADKSRAASARSVGGLQVIPRMAQSKFHCHPGIMICNRRGHSSLRSSTMSPGQALWDTPKLPLLVI